MTDSEKLTTMALLGWLLWESGRPFTSEYRYLTATTNDYATAYIWSKGSIGWVSCRISPCNFQPLPLANMPAMALADVDIARMRKKLNP